MTGYSDGMKRITLHIGDVVAVDSPAMLETVLGSCVSVCLWDSETGIGGMNHYILPEKMSSRKPSHCGDEATDILVGKLLDMGAGKKTLRAKIFGGGAVVDSLAAGFDIGRRNVEAARETLAWHGIPIVGGFTTPDCGIKLEFHSDTGRAFVKRLDAGFVVALGEGTNGSRKGGSWPA